MSPTPPEALHLFEARHHHWRGEICLYADGRMARPGFDQGSYEFVEQKRLSLRWDRWPTEELRWSEAEEVYQNPQKSFALRPVSPQAIRWNFANFWGDFDDRAFERHLVGSSSSQRFRLAEQDPQIVFESVFGRRGVGRERWPRAKQVWYTGENVAPPLDQFDGCLSFHRDIQDPRHLRWPYYLLHLASLRLTLDDLIQQGLPSSLPQERPRFCAFIASNDGCETRNRFVERLSEYRRVDCPGRVINNMSSEALGPRGNLRGKIDFLKQYKFAVCFENTSTQGSEGYVTEKVVDAMLAGCIPLYWGDHRVGEDFHVRSFVDLGVYRHDVEAMVRHVVQLDRNDDLCRAMVSEPWLLSNTPQAQLATEHFQTFLHSILKHESASSYDGK